MVDYQRVLQVYGIGGKDFKSGVTFFVNCMECVMVVVDECDGLVVVLD